MEEPNYAGEANNDNPEHPSYLTGMSEEEYDNIINNEQECDEQDDPN